MKTIVEKYNDTEIELKIPIAVYALMLDLEHKLASIGRSSTMYSIYKQLTPELQKKVVVIFK